VLVGGLLLVFFIFVAVLLVILSILTFRFWVVGRGVLRFRECRYRKTRSKFWGIIDFCALPGILGVDIILCRRVRFGGLVYKLLLCGVLLYWFLVDVT